MLTVSCRNCSDIDYLKIVLKHYIIYSYSSYLRRESVADVITVQYSPSTGVCLTDLSRLLTLHSKRKVKVGAFSAASNVTGVLTSCDAVSVLMHRAGGLVFFDYATAAPYVKVISILQFFVSAIFIFILV